MPAPRFRIGRPGDLPPPYLPHPWAAQKRHIAPEWRWAWDLGFVCWPAWHGTGDPVYPVGNAQPRATAAFVNTPSYNRENRYGLAMRYVGSNRDALQVTGLLGTPTKCSLFGFFFFNSADSDGSELITVGDGMTIRLDQSSISARGFYHYASGWREATSVATASMVGAWHSVAFTVDPAMSDQRIYIDGLDDGSASFSDAIDWTGIGSDTFIGRHISLTDKDFDGWIPITYFFNGVLSPGQVARLHQDPFGPIRASLSIVLDPGGFAAANISLGLGLDDENVPISLDTHDDAGTDHSDLWRHTSSPATDGSIIQDDITPSEGDNVVDNLANSTTPPNADITYYYVLRDWAEVGETTSVDSNEVIIKTAPRRPTNVQAN